jgi:glycosyltransferase involved in cell wall biosynthesis
MVLSVTTQAVRYGLENDVEVVVSDNASTDDTQDVVAELQANTPVRIKYHRNTTNQGAIRNILNTLLLSTGRYWMLYGDDDLMVDGALPRIVQLFRERGDVSVFVFEQEGAPDRITTSSIPASLSMPEAARQFFYYIGNAGVFAVRAEDAKMQFGRWGFEHFQTCWTQTQLAFAAMAASPKLTPALAVPLASSRSPHHTGNTVYTSWYIWETTFYSLYRAALELRPIAGDAFFRSACAHVFSMRRVLRTARDVAMYTTFYDLPGDVAQTREATKQSLRHARGRAMIPLSLMWLIAISPRAVKAAGLLGIMLARHPAEATTHVHQLRQTVRMHRFRRLQATQGGAEKPRVYAKEDL